MRLYHVGDYVRVGYVHNKVAYVREGRVIEVVQGGNRTSCPHCSTIVHMRGDPDDYVYYVNFQNEEGCCIPFTFPCMKRVHEINRFSFEDVIKNLNDTPKRIVKK